MVPEMVAEVICASATVKMRASMALTIAGGLAEIKGYGQTINLNRRFLLDISRDRSHPARRRERSSTEKRFHTEEQSNGDERRRQKTRHSTRTACKAGRAQTDQDRRDERGPESPPRSPRRS